jgi:hypothetical protein
MMSENSEAGVQPNDAVLPRIPDFQRTLPLSVTLESLIFNQEESSQIEHKKMEPLPEALEAQSSKHSLDEAFSIEEDKQPEEEEQEQIQSRAPSRSVNRLLLCKRKYKS